MQNARQREAPGIYVTNPNLANPNLGVTPDMLTTAWIGSEFVRLHMRETRF
jgi:hypothetical protein